MQNITVLISLINGGKMNLQLYQHHFQLKSHTRTHARTHAHTHTGPQKELAGVGGGEEEEDRI